MPTGYTYKIKDDINFETFILDCARAFGACVTMREESMDTPIPEEFVASDHHSKRLKETHEELFKLENMTIEEADERAEQEFKNELEERDRRIAESNILRQKYTDMLNKVEAWIPPTTEHTELKRFMRQQITESIAHDCDCSYFDRYPVIRTPSEEWLANRIEGANKDIEYHKKEYSEEVSRAKKRTLWVKQLRESIKTGL